MATILLLFVVCTCAAVSGFPVSSFEKPTSGEFSDEIELSSYVPAEFGKFKVIAVLPNPSFGIMNQDSLIPSGPVMFEDEIFNHDDDSENIVDSIKPIKKKPMSFRINSTKWNKISDMEYGERFFAKPVMVNECPTDHVYSKIQKRCLKKYISSRGSSVIG